MVFLPEVILWSPSNNNYNTASNWTNSQLPQETDAAVFTTSSFAGVSISGGAIKVGEWIFQPGTSPYSFTITSNDFSFLGGGIVDNGTSVSVLLQGDLLFDNYSTAGHASITIAPSGGIAFGGLSNGGTANITNSNFMQFADDSSAANATIETIGGASTFFFDFSTGGNAKLTADPHGTVGFFGSGPAGDHRLTAGSIAGGGTFNLGADQLTVGQTGLSGVVSGLVEGVTGSLVKAGHGSLKLSGASNTYAGGTTIERGVLDLAAIGAAGSGAIAFAGKANAKLVVENTALSSHAFGNPIDHFGRPDLLDLTGLHFHAGATATYHKATHHLAVHSGAVTDTLTLLAPHGTHFAAAGDGHGGTEVFLVIA
jgi:autotransporter-associated beta strand protein